LVEVLQIIDLIGDIFLDTV